jgi:hypothetical protein
MKFMPRSDRSGGCWRTYRSHCTAHDILLLWIGLLRDIQPGLIMTRFDYPDSSASAGANP